MSTTRTISTVSALALATALGGCVIAVGNRSYPDGPNNKLYYLEADSMQALVASNKELELGMSKEEALALYPSDLTALMTSARVNDRVVEEWRVQAYEGTRTNIKTSFRRWMYFTDNTLVRFSEERIDYANHPTMVESWEAPSVSPE